MSIDVFCEKRAKAVEKVHQLGTEGATTLKSCMHQQAGRHQRWRRVELEGEQPGAGRDDLGDNTRSIGCETWETRWEQ